MPRGVRSFPDEPIGSLDDLLGGGPAFGGSAWRFLSPDELLDALLNAPDPRVGKRKRMGRPPLPDGARGKYTKGAAWHAAAAEGRFSRGERRVGQRWRRPAYVDPRWDERSRKK